MHTYIHSLTHSLSLSRARAHTHTHTHTQTLTLTHRYPHLHAGDVGAERGQVRLGGPSVGVCRVRVRVEVRGGPPVGGEHRTHRHGALVVRDHAAHEVDRVVAAEAYAHPGMHRAVDLELGLGLGLGLGLRLGLVLGLELRSTGGRGVDAHGVLQG